MNRVNFEAMFSKAVNSEKVEIIYTDNEICVISGGQKDNQRKYIKVCKNNNSIDLMLSGVNYNSFNNYISTI